MKRLSLLFVWALAGCGDRALPPEGQVLLHVETDAPLDGSPLAPLFDRLRIEIFPEGASEPCAGCSREIAVDTALFAEGRASLGIAPAPGERVVVRLRLYRHAGAASGEPRPRSTLDAFARLPAVGEEGIVDATVVLMTERVGQPQGSLELPVEAQVGAPGASLVGSWPGAASHDCAGSPGEGEVCVPGGAFWMGDPLLELSAVPDIGGQAERLVVISPFYLDATEVTVAAFRASGLARSLFPGGPSDNPHEANTNIPGCLYTSEPSDSDPLPVNCLTWELAAEYCAALGKRLPTEAELELALSGRGVGRFVWGDSEPECGDAIYARNGECAAFGDGIEPPGQGQRDRLVLPGGAAVDLAGNLHEWAADRWNRDEEACWQPLLLDDPLCDTPSAVDGPGRSIRGGAWNSYALGTAAAMRYRLFFETQAVANDVGFRCARRP
jgi:formylglycine-generating enzyme